MKRQFSVCVRCGRTIDITNQDRDLCGHCAIELAAQGDWG